MRHSIYLTDSIHIMTTSLYISQTTTDSFGTHLNAKTGEGGPTKGDIRQNISCLQHTLINESLKIYYE